jgi:hypothetical protein
MTYTMTIEVQNGESTYTFVEPALTEEQVEPLRAEYRQAERPGSVVTITVAQD